MAGNRYAAERSTSLSSSQDTGTDIGFWNVKAYPQGHTSFSISFKPPQLSVVKHCVFYSDLTLPSMGSLSKVRVVIGAQETTVTKVKI